MGEKKINFWKIIKGIKRQSIRMQQRLIVYWCVVILTLFLVTVLLLSILGVLPGMDFKVREMLSAQQKSTVYKGLHRVTVWREGFRPSDFPCDIQTIACGGYGGNHQIHHTPLVIKGYILPSVEVAGNLTDLFRADGFHR